MASNLRVNSLLNGTTQFVQDQNGNTSPLALSTDAVAVGGNGSAGTIDVFDAGTKHTIRIGSAQGPGRIGLGGNGSVGTIDVFDANTKHTIRIGSAQGAGRIGLGGNGSTGTLDVFDANTNHTIRISSAEGSGHIGLGGNGSIGAIDVFDAHTNNTIRIGSAQGPGRIGLGGNGSAGVIDIFDSNTTQTIRIDGQTGDVQVSGDIRLTNADCAEDFDIDETQPIEPGTVMVVGEEGRLEQSHTAYDRRVAGVVSGAGDYKPGIVLDRQQSSDSRKPIALLGKVFCKADAGHGAIEIGDLLTTSPTPGHAMKAADPTRTPGAVIGKALRALDSGQGLIPLLIALQ